MGEMYKQVYTVYWAHIMVKATKAVKLVASAKGRYTPWETVVTPHTFMLRSIDQITYMDNLRKRKESAWRNRTMEDLEKEEKSEMTSVPPPKMKEARKGLCTYAYFLKMAGL